MDNSQLKHSLVSQVELSPCSEDSRHRLVLQVLVNSNQLSANSSPKLLHSVRLQHSSLSLVVEHRLKPLLLDKLLLEAHLNSKLLLFSVSNNKLNLQLVVVDCLDNKLKLLGAVSSEVKALALELPDKQLAQLINLVSKLEAHCSEVKNQPLLRKDLYLEVPLNKLSNQVVDFSGPNH